MKVRAHTCYLGHTGFAAHSRSFFRELSKHVELKIRNYTWDSNPKLDDIDYSILDKITLRNSDNIEVDYPISQTFPDLPWIIDNDFNQDIDIVLMEQNHKYFYDNYNGIKIAYVVWESTELEANFFNQLLTFDYLWVVSKWHKEVIVKQGYPESKITIINEGVDPVFSTPISYKKRDKFRFLFFGRWEYRKSVTEILTAFKNTFNNENVELILSADNVFATDNLNSTEERLAKYSINDDRISVIHFPTRDEYINYIKTGDVLITCARSEGWNIPLIEAMSAGTPVIYSNWGAQLEFAKGLGNPVNILYELPASIGMDVPGLYSEPDFKDLERVLMNCYTNFNSIKELAIEESIFINENFNWTKIGLDAINTLRKISPIINIDYNNGPFVEILGGLNHKYNIKFIDKEYDYILYEDNIGANNWCRCSIQYFINWRIEIKNLSTNEIIVDEFDIENKFVRIKLESSSLGDTIAWFPHINEFSVKNNCKVIVSTFKNFLFDTTKYSNIMFVEPYENFKTYTTFEIGWFYDNGNFNKFKNPVDFKNLPLQSTTTNILGLNYKPLKPFIKVSDTNRPIDNKYVCIAIHSTAQAKYWNNPTGWQEITDYYKLKGYEVVIVSSEPDGYMDNHNPKGCTYMTDNSIDTLITYLYNCELFIGISSGISWLSWALDKETVIISGFSKPITEPMDDNIIRVFKGGVCNGCFNRNRLDAGDWNWCPDQKGTPRQFECSKTISSEDVLSTIVDHFKKLKNVEVIVQESYDLGMVQNHKEILDAANFFKTLNVKNFMEIGTDQGGSFAIWSKLSVDGIRISVDLPHGMFGRTDYDEHERDNYLRSLGSNVHMYWGSSHDITMLKTVEEKLNGVLLDFMFIDGDHTYEGVKQDFEMYKHLVRPGGWIAFHDIKDTEFHRSANCRVDQLWSELQGVKHEFVDWTSNYGGIGFIQV